MRDKIIETITTSLQPLDFALQVRIDYPVRSSYRLGHEYSFR